MEYFLNGIKEISVTDSFLSMGENVRGCLEESYDDCTAKKYKNALIDKCQCLPFQLRLNEEVSSKNINSNAYK